jgi:predicted ATPase
MSLQNSTEIESLLELLDTHRATLLALHKQRAHFTEGYVPAHIDTGITQACSKVADLKNHLQVLDHPVKDLALDFPPVVAPAKNQTSQSSWSMFSRSKDYNPQPDQQNRQTLIDTMRLRYQERLEAISQTIPLALANRPNAVNPLGADRRPYDLTLRQTNQADKLLPKDSRLNDLFDQSQGQLLILGAPGAGKSFLLYELAHELVERADADSSLPVPVIFSLASWQPDQSLQEWMITDLSQRYNTKSQNIERLFNTNSILPLLDGLDEVDTLERRKQCVAAIHTYQAEKHLAPPLVVTCREREYRDLPELHLNTALVVQPLTSTEINDYLADPEFAQLRQALAQDSSLAHLAQTPLFLSFMAATYRNHAPQLPNHTNSKTVRQIVLGDYVSYCCGTPNNPKAFKVPVTKLRAFLAWLASGMIAHNNQQDFYIEFLQPTWLPSRRSLQIWQGLIIFILGLTGGLAMILAIILAAGWIVELTKLLVGGFVVGLMGGFAIAGGVGLDKIYAPELWRWSWRSYISKLKRNLIFGVIFGLMIGLIFGQVGKIGEILINISVTGISIGFIGGAVGGVSNGFVTNYLIERQTPNQAIRRSIAISIIGGLGFGVIFGLGIGVILGVIGGVMIGQVVGQIFGIVFGIAIMFVGGILGGVFGGVVIGLLQFGGRAILQHYSLRLILSLSTSAPFLLVPWLEEACKRGLLMRIGGGYRFRHELLQRHFATHQEPGFPLPSFLAETENKSQAQPQ